jgi:hypothetical protein
LVHFFFRSAFCLISSQSRRRRRRRRSSGGSFIYIIHSTLRFTSFCSKRLISKSNDLFTQSISRCGEKEGTKEGRKGRSILFELLNVSVSRQFCFYLSTHSHVIRL